MTKSQGKGKGKPPAGMAEEQRLARIFGALAIAAAIISFATLIIQLASLGPDMGRAAEFRDYDDSRGIATLGTGLRLLSLLVLPPVAVFLYKVVQRRESSAPAFIRQLGIYAPIVLAVVSLVGYFAYVGVVDDFLDLPGAAQNNESADRLNDDSTLLKVQTIASYAASAGFGGWIAVTSAAAMGVGLMPRFLAYFGYGVGALMVLDPRLGPALFVGWLVSLGLLMLDRWPGGRPLAWDSGKAEPPL